MTAPCVTRGSTDEWLARDAAALAGVLPRSHDVVAERGEGSWLVDVDGARYLDLGSGIGVLSTGHCHPDVVAAVQQQVATLVHTSVTTHHTLNVRLAERLRELTPFVDDAQVFFCNSGAEAVDGAVKLARRVTGRPGVVAFRHAFHGRTLAATTLTTAKERYREGYEPLLPGVHHAPYGSGLDELDRILAVHGPAIGLVLVEPVLGEGGYVVPERAWLAGLRERCDAHGIVLAFDEVQSGVGRTGRMWAAQTLGVHPDVVLFAKGIASGLPLGGIIAPRRLAERWPTGTHGSTFGGNPVACAAALATLDVLERGGCLERARELGERARDRLGRELAGCRAVQEVRGVGLMIGVQLRDKATAVAATGRCLAAGVIVLTCGPGEDVLRLVPPLTITDAELDHGLDVVVAALLDA